MADQEVYASDDDLHYIEFWDVQTYKAFKSYNKRQYFSEPFPSISKIHMNTYHLSGAHTVGEWWGTGLQSYSKSKFKNTDFVDRMI